MGHFGWDALKQLEKADRGVEIQDGHTKPQQICESCAVGKGVAKRTSKEKPERCTAAANLERLHSDICGPVLPASRKGNTSFILFIDEKTRAINGYAIKAKSQAPDKIESAILEFERRDRRHKVQRLRCDNAKELISKRVQEMLLKRGIVPETSAPYSPNQNGLVERYNRTVLEMIRCLLHQANFPAYLWEDAFEVALHILNRRVNAQTGGIPIEELTGEKADLSHLKAFGAEARVVIDNGGKKLSKLAPRTRKAFFLG